MDSYNIPTSDSIIDAAKGPNLKSDGNDDNEISLLKQKLSETEGKLVKFKSFVVSLRNERNQLKEKISEDNSVIEKLKAQVSKSQNSNQLFQNFQILQNEYDKNQDEIEQYKKTTKNLENDLMNCMEEMNHLKEMNINQKEEIKSLKNHISQQDSQIETQKEAMKEFESKIIILETKINNEQAKVQNYELIVCEMNKLKDELKLKIEKIHELSGQIDNQSIKINEYETKIKENNEVIEKYEMLKKENINISNEIEKNRHIIENNKKEIDKFQQNEIKYKSKIAILEKNIDDLQLSNSEKIASLELETYDLKNKLQLSEADLKNNNFKFEEYKSKVVNVLKENKLNNCDYSRNMEILNLKIENIQEENKILRNENENLSNVAQHLKEEKNKIEMQFATLKNQLREYEVLKQSFNLLTMENDKLNTTIKQLQISFAKEKSQISETNKEHLDDIRTDYENKIKDLEEELSRLRNASDESNSVVNSNTSFEEIKDENSSTQSNISSLEKNFLEEILSIESSLKSPTKNGLNVDNLTQLLAESENNISLLTEQNRVLKEEIRRLHRNIDRLDIANNLEYLKNVLLKFMTIKRQDEKKRLISVLSTILKLTTEETNVFQEFIPENLQNKSLTSWNLWQWSS